MLNWKSASTSFRGGKRIRSYEYQKKLTALKEQGLSEEEAVAQIESELPLPSPVPPENDEYGLHLAPEKAARDRHALRRGPRRSRRGGGALSKIF